MKNDRLRRERLVELNAADLAKNEFLAMLAHELRNPLAPIRAAAQLLGTHGVPAAVIEKNPHHPRSTDSEHDTVD